MKILLFFILFFNILFASSLESLLEEYEDTSLNSLHTLNDKMGHSIIYSQKELKVMQYDRLSDILKELPILNLNRSSFGASTFSLNGTKTEASGYFRLFINDHEVSSAYTQSPFLSWYELPISLVDYIEIYYGEGSFTLGSETGVKFIRVYTKKASKENGGSLKTTIANNSNNSQEFSYAAMLENGWSYLMHFTNQNSFFDKPYEGEQLDNDTTQQYFFLDVSNEKNRINIGYTKSDKEIYQGFSLDSNSDDGNITSKNLYINYNRYFLNDNSLKLNLSVDKEIRQFYEKNAEGLGLVRNHGLLARNITSFYDESEFLKLNASLSKTFKTERNNFFTSISVNQKKYDYKNRSVNGTSVAETPNNFDKETTFSFAVQDDYKILDNLMLIGNVKIDKYKRNGEMEDSTENLYRIGSIYLPTKNLGFKTFYTISQIPPSFYNADFASQYEDVLESQKYKYFTFETAYTYNKSRISLEYFNVHIDNYIYYVDPIYAGPFVGMMPIGFINVDHEIKTNGFIFDYIYNIDKNSKFEINYFVTQLTESQSNYTDGGFLKYMKTYDKFSYFTSLIYRKGYDYLDLNIPNSYNLNVGATYNYTKNLSISIKATNALDKSTQSILIDSNGGATNTTLIDDYDRAISLSLKWRF